MPRHAMPTQGVHVCHIVVDGAVNAPDTLGRMLDMGGGKGTFAKFADQARRRNSTNDFHHGL